MGIGPSTKETSLHHFRDPLLNVVSSDDDLDLMGIILVGTPDINEEKILVSTRAAIMAEAMRPDGVITSTDGWLLQHGGAGRPSGNSCGRVAFYWHLRQLCSFKRLCTKHSGYQ